MEEKCKSFIAETGMMFWGCSFRPCGMRYRFQFELLHHERFYPYRSRHLSTMERPTFINVPLPFSIARSGVFECIKGIVDGRLTDSRSKKSHECKEIGTKNGGE